MKEQNKNYKEQIAYLNKGSVYKDLTIPQHLEVLIQA